jgi:pimeloyl-ACP methyl ester carboxylesterase
VREGRVFGVAEWGPPSAEKTVLWFHGTPGARRQVPEPARRYAQEHGVRLIGMDRPGVGLSTPHMYHRLSEFSDDLAVALTNLKVDRFSVVALSGGAPYALAAAHAFPERVAVLGILGGVVPSGGEDGIGGGLVGFGVKFRRFLPVMSEPAGALLTLFVRAAKPVGSFALDTYARFSPPGDRELLGTPEHKEMFLDDLSDNGGHSMRAVLYDAILFTRYWGFSVRDIDTRVVWWQGDEDNIVPLSHAQHIVPLFPNAELRIMPGGGHLTALSRGVEVMETVLDW